MTTRAYEERLRQLAYRLEYHIAALTTEAFDTINERLSRADGYPNTTRGCSTPAATPHTDHTGPCTVPTCPHRRPCPDHDGSTLTSVERDAEIHYELAGAREQIRDNIATIEQMVDDYQRMLRRIIGRPHTGDIVTPLVPMCRDNQLGKHAADEWGDPLCPKPADKAGLCGAHYMAWYRAKRRDGIRIAGDHEPAA